MDWKLEEVRRNRRVRMRMKDPAFRPKSTLPNVRAAIRITKSSSYDDGSRFIQEDALHATIDGLDEVLVRLTLRQRG